MALWVTDEKGCLSKVRQRGVRWATGRKRMFEGQLNTHMSFGMRTRMRVVNRISHGGCSDGNSNLRTRQYVIRVPSSCPTLIPRC